MAEEFKPGQIVPESGVYRITHDPVHAEMPHEVTVIKRAAVPHVSSLQGVHSLIPEPLRDGHRAGIE